MIARPQNEEIFLSWRVVVARYRYCIIETEFNRPNRGNPIEPFATFMRQAKYLDEQNRLVMMRIGNVADQDRSFDIEFWQSQDDTARFDAAWELGVLAHELKGQSEDELRLQRSIESIERLDLGASDTNPRGQNGTEKRIRKG